MADLATMDCFQPGLVKLERVAYFNRMLLTADDMRTEQEWVRQKLRRHNRFLHGWGVVCGLVVTAAPTATAPWRVRVADGYALGPYGDEIFVGEPVFMDLAECGPGAATSPCEPGLLRTIVPASGPEIFLAIKYAECKARPVLAMPAGCACEDEACEYSRIRDSFEIECLGELPPSHQPPPGAPSLCDIARGRAFAGCPPCPAEPWVVLARVRLPASPLASITEPAIDNRVRRIVFSTAMLQQQLIECCCREQPEPPEPPEPPRRAADLAVRKDARADPGNRRIRYEIRVRNEGDLAADNVVVEDRLTAPDPAGIEVLEFEPPELWTQTTAPVFAARLPRLEPGQGVNLGFTVLSRAFGAFRNDVSVRSDTPDRDLANNTHSILTELRG